MLDEMEALGSPENVEGMKRFGINSAKAFGITAPVLRQYARKHGKNHELALALWDTGVHEVRVLSALIDEPAKVTEKQMDKWVHDFDSWAVCDGCCGELFQKTPYAYAKAIEWCAAEEEFVRRAGFVMMAELAVHDKKAPDENFTQFFPYLKQYAYDGRNFVKKAVNWAIRQIGKRNQRLHPLALELAGRIREQGSSSARWIAADAIRELQDPKIIARIKP